MLFKQNKGLPVNPATLYFKQIKFIGAPFFYFLILIFNYSYTPKRIEEMAKEWEFPNLNQLSNGLKVIIGHFYSKLLPYFEPKPIKLLN